MTDAITDWSGIINMRGKSNQAIRNAILYRCIYCGHRKEDHEYTLVGEFGACEKCDCGRYG